MVIFHSYVKLPKGKLVSNSEAKMKNRNYLMEISPMENPAMYGNWWQSYYPLGYENGRAPQQLLSQLSRHLGKISPLPAFFTRSMAFKALAHMWLHSRWVLCLREDHQQLLIGPQSNGTPIDEAENWWEDWWGNHLGFHPKFWGEYWEFIYQSMI